MPDVIAIISGEVSGDQYAAHLIRSWLACHPQTQFTGIGFQASCDAGLKPWPGCALEKIMGMQVFKFMTRVRSLLKNIKHQLSTTRPDVLVLIDYAGFNLKVLKLAKVLGIPCFYYIPPKTWAWGSYRLKTLRLADGIGVHYPFEYDYFQAKGLPVKRIYHPFIEQLQNFDYQPVQENLALLPGSRPQELKQLLPIMLASVKRLNQHMGRSYKVNIFSSDADSHDMIQPLILTWQHQLDIACVHPTQKLQVIKQCQVAVVCSGTATFEVAMLGIPQIVIYKTSMLTYAIFKHLIKTPWISLPNIMANQAIIPELIQYSCTPDKIFNHLIRLLTDSNTSKEQLNDVKTIASKMSNRQDSVSIINAIETCLTGRVQSASSLLT